MTKDEIVSWLRLLGQSFHSHWDNKALPWYAEEKAHAGAFSTFLGLTFSASIDGLSWHALAIGDTCLIHRRGDRIQSSFPLNDSGQFGFRPFLLPSDTARQPAAIEQLIYKEGSAESGDVFLLLTDAIAAWYLDALNLAPELAASFDELLAANRREAFQQHVTKCIGDGSLRNDDIAAIRIAISDEDTIIADSLVP
jgi:hypothetical protein